MSKTLYGNNANFSNANLLIVEDNDDHWCIMHKAMQLCLSEVKVQRVVTPKQAVGLLQDLHYQEWGIPKLILLDLYLPKRTDGLELVKQIRAMASPISKIPIVMLTHSADHIDIKEAYQLGISAYLVKPTAFADWLTSFGQMRTYWWETVTLPPLHYSF